MVVAVSERQDPTNPKSKQSVYNPSTARRDASNVGTGFSHPCHSSTPDNKSRSPHEQIHQTSRCVRGANIKHKPKTYIRIRDCRLNKHTHKSDYQMLPTWPPASNRFNMINRHLLSICNQQVSEACCQYLRMKLHLSCTRALSFKAPCPTIWHRMQAILYIVLWMHGWNKLKLHSFTVEFEMFCCKTTAKLKHPEIPKLIHQSRPEPRTSRELLGVMVRTKKSPPFWKFPTEHTQISFLTCKNWMKNMYILHHLAGINMEQPVWLPEGLWQQQTNDLDDKWRIRCLGLNSLLIGVCFLVMLDVYVCGKRVLLLYC